jgi:hypothetical protein
MKKFLFVTLLILILAVVGAGFLLTWNMPPPTAAVEKVLPDNRFPK